MSARSPCESGREYVSSARECKEPSASSFKPYSPAHRPPPFLSATSVLAGASPVTGAISHKLA